MNAAATHNTTGAPHVLIMAGGTGGHVFPALAVAQALIERGARVSWLGTAAGIEARLVPANDLELHTIDVAGLRGKGALSWFAAPLRLARACLQALGLVRRLAPQLVVGMGGFASGPGGTHGKTTTTSLVAALLAGGGLDPTFIVGGKVLGANSNARLGEGPYLVAEADESDASFLLLTPMMAIVTNIDADHLETYGGEFSRLTDTFVEFLHHLPFYGLAVLCADDPVVRSILPDVGRPIVTYGIDHGADIMAENLSFDGTGTHFTLRRAGHEGYDVHLNLPGKHNVLNALAAAAVAHELGVDMPAIGKALSQFEGIGRRCEIHGEITLGGREVLLVDDYGHHPRELISIIGAARNAWPERRLVVVFQPHRFSRTRDLFDDFCQVLAELDVLVLCEVYAAGEAPIANADGRALARGVRARGKTDPVFVDDVHRLSEVLPGILRDGDVLLTLGAGDIGAVAQQMAHTINGGVA